MSIDKEFQEMLDGAKYDIKINGEGIGGEIDGKTNAMGEIIAVALLVSFFAEQRKMTLESYMELVSGFLGMGDIISADSQEELDVMQELIKIGGKIDGWNS